MKSIVRNKMLAIGLALFSSAVVVNAAKQTFTGKVKPMITSTIQYGTNDTYRGFVVYAARQGQILHGPTYNLKGDVIQHGDILVSLDKDYNTSLMEQAKADLAIKKAALAFQKIEYDRYKKLAKTEAVSQELYQNYVSTYFQALSEYNQSEEALKTREIELDLCDYRVEYDCIVDKTLMPFGLCAGELAVEIISQLDPMGVAIKMDRATARKITPQTAIAVYPMLSDKPVAPLHYMTVLTDEGITLRVRNFAVLPDNLEDGKIPIVQCYDAITLYSNKKTNGIAVPKTSVQKDEKGFYVWKGIGENSNQVDKGINPIFPVKKVYLEYGNINRYCANFISYMEVIPQKGEQINVGDLIVLDPPKGLQDNEKVCFYKEVYQFMPGDNVKVEIDL